MAKIKPWKIISFFAVSIILVLILLSFVSFQDLKQSFSLVSWRIVFIAFIFYAFANFLRMMRFQSVFNLGKFNLFNIVNLHNFFNNLLPMRLGELSLFYFLKKKNVETSKSVSYFFLFRLFDFFSIVLIFLFALMMLGNVPEFFEGIVYFISVIAIVFLLVFISFREFGKYYVLILEKIGIKGKFLKFLIKAYKSLKNVSYSKYFYLMFISLLLWGSLHFANYLIIRELDASILVSIVIIASSMTIFTNLLPIHGVAGFGTMESLWAATLLFFGFAKEFAVSSAFVLHVFQFLFLTVLALFSFFARRISFRTDKSL